MKATGTFKIRRYWFNTDTPADVLATLNHRWGNPRDLIRAPYVDINYYGDGDRNITLMEMRYSEYIMDREEIVYTVEGDDGL